MTDQTDVIKISDLSRVALSPDDVLIYRSPRYLPLPHVAQLKAAFHEACPGTRVVVIEGPGELAVMEPTDVHGFSEWHLGALQHLYEYVDRALSEEGIDGKLRDRIMYRIVYGVPDPDVVTTSTVAPTGSL